MKGSHTVQISTDKSLVHKHSNQYLWSRGVESNQGLMDKTGNELLCYSMQWQKNLVLEGDVEWSDCFKGFIF